MLHRNFAARKARGGKELIPPNPKQWSNEDNAIELREELRLPLDRPLIPDTAFALLPGVAVMPHGELPAAQMWIDHFRGTGLRSWSGMGIPLPGGKSLVIYNDAHPPNRIRATLMEEFFHLRLRHPATSIRVYSTDGAFRNYDGATEGEAYGSGAAALVPYITLKRMIGAGKNARRIAFELEVSEDLVVFRAKVTKLYRQLRFQ